MAGGCHQPFMDDPKALDSDLLSPGELPVAGSTILENAEHDSSRSGSNERFTRSIFRTPCMSTSVI